MNSNHQLKASPLLLFTKRALDIILSVAGLLVGMPLILIIIILFLLEGQGGIIYSQERIGLHGHPFMIYKFRTMRRHAEEEQSPQLWTKGDPRVTQLGHFLRTYHLDELPQLWNVIRGDMSIIGYRPERQFFIDQIMAQDPRYEYLYQLRPGIFSKATLYNGYTDTMEKMLTRLEMDLEYLNDISIIYDFKILLLTACAIFSGKKF